MSDYFQFHPLPLKYVGYHQDGGGRDHYIGFLNNGIPKDKVQYKAGYYEIGSMRKYQLKKTQSLPKINHKYKHYNADGTGRDTYVIVDEGGQCASPNLLAKQSPNYLSSLRFYPKTSLAPKDNDFLRRTMGYISEKHSLKSQLRYEQQQQHALKLSVPRKKNLKRYQIMNKDQEQQK